MTISYTVTEARAHLGEVVNKAQYGNEIVEITQHGHLAAVVISAQLHAYYQELEDARDLADAERVRAAGAAPIPHAEVAARFGLAPDGRRL